MKKLSLRMRLTIMVVGIIVVICAALTFGSMFTANSILWNEGTMDAATVDTAEMYPSAQAAENAQKQFNTASLLLMGGITLAGGFLAYWLLGIMLRPLDDFARQVGNVTESELNTRLPLPGKGTEIDRLAEGFNRTLDRLEKAFDSQKRFSAAAAHELKTPLTIIKSNTDVLHITKEPTLERYDHVVQVVENQTRRMIGLVDGLLAISNQQEYSYEDEVHLDALIGEVVRDVEPRAAERDITIALNEGTSVPLVGNAPMLARAFQNLIENAVRYGKPSGRVDITLMETADGSVIEVADDGPGIPAEHTTRIFEPFYRVDSSRSRKEGGSGLGLAIARDTMRRHGGEITYRTNEPSGAVFVVNLPSNMK